MDWDRFATGAFHSGAPRRVSARSDLLHGVRWVAVHGNRRKNARCRNPTRASGHGISRRTVCRTATRCGEVDRNQRPAFRARNLRNCIEGDSVVKKRKRSRRQHSKSKGGSSWLGALTKPAKRDRRAWTFERLEERYLFTAAPLTGLEGLQTYSVSNSTAEGQQLIDAIEQMWAAHATTPSRESGGG